MASYRPAYLRSEHCQASAANESDPNSDPSRVVRHLLTQVSQNERDAVETHQVYSQLDCLQTVKRKSGGCQAEVWREKFRWIKYEEELESVGNRWSKPHIPILSPFSLMEARHQLDTGVVQLQTVKSEGSQSQNLQQAKDHLEQLMKESGLHEDCVAEVVRLLSRPHCRFSDKMKQVLDNDENSESNHDSLKFNKKYRKKVEKSAEACEIMVGTSDAIRHTVSAFIRFSDPIRDPILEIDLPIRFLFVVIAPKTPEGINVINIGRSLASMMADQIFHEVAYVVKDKSALLASVDEFLKNASILPPIGCSKTDRMPPPLKPPDMRHRQFEADSTVELSEGDIPGLERTGMLFGGLIGDVKRKLPYYISDFTDALHPQTIGSFFFIYFACITPIITFGGLLADATKGYLGAIESILSGVICGVSFSLFAGQPLTILGSTGPVLVFETIVFNNCERFGLEYLPMRWWIGMWTCFFLILVVAFDLSYLVKYITRFTEESFAMLIAVIFIYEAINKLLKISVDYPINWDWYPKMDTVIDCSCVQNPNRSMVPVPYEKAIFLPTYSEGNTTYANFTAFDYYSFDWKLYWKNCEKWGGMWIGEGCGNYRAPDVFFFSCLLFIFTYFISSELKAMKTANIFPAFVRGILSDFAVMIAICVMTLADFVAGLHTPKLLIPEKFEPTLGFSVRQWIVHPFGRNEYYTAFIAIGPAILAVILLFLDQQITAVIVNRRENKLVKGVGYHLDLLVMAICVGINTALGIPWFVAATVLSINHVLSLKKETECTAPGEVPTFLGCRENRATGFLVFFTIGLSVFLTSVLKHIPMPVLYGVFLFMGTASLNGLQLYQRLFLFIQPEKYQPDFPFLRCVKMRRVHLFTLIQLICFALLWAVKKTSYVSIFFPLMVLSLCFIRKLLDFLFDREELRLLDDLFPGQVKEERVQSRRASKASGARNETKEDVEEETKLCDSNA